MIDADIAAQAGSGDATARRGTLRSGAPSPRASAKTAAKAAGRAATSLRSRAIAFLARRDFSRVELRARLLRDARARKVEASDIELNTELDEALDAMQALGYLGEDRVVESVVNRKSAKLGTARIKQELKHLGISADASEEALAQLRTTEFDRASEVWRKKFRDPPADRDAQTKQMRFLASRGFAEGVIRQVVPAVPRSSPRRPPG